MTEVVNIRHEEYDVRIDRRSRWGNPFKIGPDGNREEVIEKHHPQTARAGGVGLEHLTKRRPGSLSGLRPYCVRARRHKANIPVCGIWRESVYWWWGLCV